MEDYEKKYKQALEDAKRLYEQGTITESLAYIFPELRGDEDERIRKALIKGVESCKASGWTNFGNNVDIDVALAWLEKRGESYTKKDVDDAYLKGIFDTKQGKQDARYLYLEEIIAADDIYQMSMNDAMVNEAKEKAAKALSKLGIGKLLGFEKQGEQKPVDKVEPFDKYEGLTDFERALADICIGWIGEELGWKQYIKDSADVLLKIAIKKFNSIQDAPFEQKSAAWSDEDEKMYKIALSCIETLEDISNGKNMHADVKDWLKSLKERIGE